LPVEWKLQT